MYVFSEAAAQKLGNNAARFNVLLTILFPQFSGTEILFTPCCLNEMLLYFACKKVFTVSSTWELGQLIHHRDWDKD
jgi:hypothetical protein